MIVAAFTQLAVFLVAAGVGLATGGLWHRADEQDDPWFGVAFLVMAMGFLAAYPAVTIWTPVVQEVVATGYLAGLLTTLPLVTAARRGAGYAVRFVKGIQRIGRGAVRGAREAITVW